MYGHVITKFSGMGRFTKLWGSTHVRARGAPLLLSSLAKVLIKITMLQIMKKERQTRFIMRRKMERNRKSPTRIK